MRLLIALLFLACPALAAVPPELEAALKNFRSDPPPGWSYTQTTTGEGRSTVERCDAAKPDYARWSLVQKDGRAPTAAELADYAEGRSRRSRAGTAPRITEQLLLETLETIDESPERATYRCRLRRGENRDNTAEHLRATLVLHRASGAIESITLASTGPFRPGFGVSIAEMKTEMTYALPAGTGAPSLPQRVVSRVRGTAFWFKSLDAEMSVVFSEYERAGKK
ncbi:MAG: hypothetical protein JNL39_15620 [Opitutaceae bacterium]|nr:hypothetical protein [Opitutaceae bacterium]